VIDLCLAIGSLVQPGFLEENRVFEFVREVSCRAAHRREQPVLGLSPGLVVGGRCVGGRGRGVCGAFF